ncbi:hypothetical protein OUZ56_032475 [Daphnia magna]|uniref:Carbohydrate-binding domain-containing protein n=1 Tax=Daphnia magna TaxID=35525 RepID=A0ABR0B900_9CRUS|nr:hypothetical protein OUZ56_032475 [Daphnia magna]
MNKRFFFTLAPLAVILTLSGCVGSNKGLSDDDKERLQPYVVDVAPADITQLDGNFENKLRIIGYKLDRAVATPGSTVKVTLYWKCEEKLDDGWMLFTHVDDPVSNQVTNFDWGSAIREQKGDRQILGPDRWEKGKVYVDEIDMRIPDWGPGMGPELRIMTGIWRKDDRLRVLSGANDGDNRAILFTLKTGRTPTKVEESVSNCPPARKSSLTARRTRRRGRWRRRPEFSSTCRPGAEQGLPGERRGKITWDDANMYVLFEVKDPTVTGGFNDPKAQPTKFTVTGLPKLWTEDTVEIMTDPDGDGDNVDYYELQINPQNKVFHSQFDARQKPEGGENGPFGHEDWAPKLKSAVVVKGTLDKPEDKDEGYTVETAIPWSAFAKAKNHPPRNGDTWRMNFYAMEKNSGVSWSPILKKGNFHYAPRFGKVEWFDPAAKVETPDAGVGDAGAASTGAGGSDAGKPGTAASSAPSGSAPSPKKGTLRLPT